MIRGVDLLEHIFEALRVDLPAHLCVAGSRHGNYLLGVSPHLLVRASGRGQRWCAEDLPLVVVDAQEVQRRGDALHIAVEDRWRVYSQRREEIRRVAALEEWPEKPLVMQQVGGTHTLQRLGFLIRRVHRSQVQCNAKLCARSQACPQPRHRKSMCEQQMVSSGDGRLHVGYSWGMCAEGVSQIRDAPGLIVRDPPLDPVAKPPRHNLRIVGERLGGLAVEPSATTLQRSGQIPVM